MLAHPDIIVEAYIIMAVNCDCCRFSEDHKINRQVHNTTDSIVLKCLGYDDMFNHLAETGDKLKLRG